MISIKNISYLNQQGNRENIEDAIYPAPGQASQTDKLFLVCDGVGGESKGEEASRIASEGFAAYFKSQPITDGANADSYMSGAQAFVIDEMQQYIRRFPEAARMSTTLTLAYVLDNKILIAWCGDSRIYQFRDGEVVWRSTDHSLVSMLVQQGEISEEEAEHHPKKNVILRSISAAGAPATIETKWLTDVRAGDDILLCTDGVLEQMTPGRLKIVLQSPAEDKAPLFMSYCEGKTGDNFSLYLFKINTGAAIAANVTSAVRPKQQAAKKSNTTLILVVVALLVLIAVAAVFLFKGKEAAKPTPPAVVDTPKNQADTAKHDESTVVVPAEINKKDKTTNKPGAKPQGANTVKPKPSQTVSPAKPKKGQSGKQEIEKADEKQNEEQKASPEATPPSAPPTQVPTQTPTIVPAKKVTTPDSKPETPTVLKKEKLKEV